jgi:hypothetical protein
MLAAGLDPAGLDPAGLDLAGLDPAGLDVVDVVAATNRARQRGRVH